MQHIRRVVIALLILVTTSTFAQEDEQYVIGVIGYFDLTALTTELNSLGYVEGENVTFVPAIAEGWETMGAEEMMSAFMEATEEVSSMPDIDIFVTNTDSDAVFVNSLLSDPTTPIVFARSDDPVATGAVADLMAPGGNITGVVTNEPHSRRLQILTELKPDTDKVLYLYSTMTLEAEVVFEQVKATAEMLGIELIPAPMTDAASGIKALEEMPEGVDWLFMTPYVPFDFELYGLIMTKSLEHKAGIAGVLDVPMYGYVISYGPSLDLTDQQAARNVDRILRGANPGEMPVQIAENRLAINLEAATAIDMEIPVGILRQADVIARAGDFDEMGLYIGGN